MEKFTINDWLDIHKEVEKAREDDTPYYVHNSSAIVGDANKTEKKKEFSYDVEFRFDKSELPKIPEGAKVAGRFVTFSHHFEDININPRNDLKLVEALINIFPIMKAFEDNLKLCNDKAKEIDPDVEITDGRYVSNTKQDEMSELELERNKNFIHIYNEAGDEGQISIYKFVQTLLNIDDELADHMKPVSVLNVLYATIINNPEIVNEAETVFGY